MQVFIRLILYSFIKDYELLLNIYKDENLSEWYMNKKDQICERKTLKLNYMASWPSICRLWYSDLEVWTCLVFNQTLQIGRRNHILKHFINIYIYVCLILESKGHMVSILLTSCYEATFYTYDQIIILELPCIKDMDTLLYWSFIKSIYGLFNVLKIQMNSQILITNRFCNCG